MSQTESSISRRDLLRKGAVAGAVAWTAPVVLSSPAFAATGACSGSKPCTDFYYLKFDRDDGCASNATGADGKNACGSLPIPSSLTCGQQTYLNGCDVTSDWDFDDDTVDVLLPVGAIPVVLRIKPGESCTIYELPSLSSNPTPLIAHSNNGGVECTGASAYLAPVPQTDWLHFHFSADCANGISHFSMVFCL